MLDAIEAEVASQGRVLSNFSRKSIGELPSGTMLVGAGDSFVAAQGASVLSSLRLAAADPYAVTSSPKMAEGKAVVFISVSGRTKANLGAAKAVQGIASRTIALTSNARSPLVKAVDRKILIPYDYKPRIPGTLSFTLSLLATLKIAGVGPKADFSKALKLALGSSLKPKISTQGMTFFLGNRASYVSSMYAAAKLYEFLGARSQAQQLEEFSHMEAFSLREDDSVNVFAASDPLGMGRRLAAELHRRGFDSVKLPRVGSNDVEQMFFEVFLAQTAVLQLMREKQQGTPYFLKSGKLLSVSDSMIY